MPKGAAVLGGYGTRQVAVGHTVKHTGDVAQPRVNRIHQGIQIARQLEKEAALALSRHALTQVAMRGRLDQCRHFLFNGYLSRPIDPLDRRPQAITTIIQNGRHGQIEAAAAHMNGDSMGRAEALKQCALVRQILVKKFDVLAHQIASREVAQILADICLRLSEHTNNRPVEINDVQIPVDNHHIGCHVVETDLDTPRFFTHANSVVQIKTKFHLHALQAIEHLTEFIALLDRNH